MTTTICDFWFVKGKTLVFLGSMVEDGHIYNSPYIVYAPFINKILKSKTLEDYVQNVSILLTYVHAKSPGKISFSYTHDWHPSATDYSCVFDGKVLRGHADHETSYEAIEILGKATRSTEVAWALRGTSGVI